MGCACCVEALQLKVKNADNNKRKKSSKVRARVRVYKNIIFDIIISFLFASRQGVCI